MKKLEKILLAVVITIMVCNVLFFALPLSAGKPIMICGIAHDEDPAFCNFEVEANCCLVIGELP